MFRIKRIKRVAMAMHPAVHYATSVAPAGSLNGLTTDISQAAVVSEEVTEKVRSFYAGNLNAGTLVFEPIAPPVPEPEPEREPCSEPKPPGDPEPVTTPTPAAPEQPPAPTPAAIVPEAPVAPAPGPRTEKSGTKGRK